MQIKEIRFFVKRSILSDLRYGGIVIPSYDIPIFEASKNIFGK